MAGATGGKPKRRGGGRSRRGGRNGGYGGRRSHCRDRNTDRFRLPRPPRRGDRNRHPSLHLAGRCMAFLRVLRGYHSNRSLLPHVEYLHCVRPDSNRTGRGDRVYWGADDYSPRYVLLQGRKCGDRVRRHRIPGSLYHHHSFLSQTSRDALPNDPPQCTNARRVSSDQFRGQRRGFCSATEDDLYTGVRPSPSPRRGFSELTVD